MPDKATPECDPVLEICGDGATPGMKIDPGAGFGPAPEAGSKHGQAGGSLYHQPDGMAGGMLCCPAAACCNFSGAKKGWRKRHPFLFWLLLLLFFVIFLNLFGVAWRVLDERGVFSGPRLGVIKLEGLIVDSAAVLEWTARLQENSNVAGVLLYINSPGGAVVPSQEIFAAVKRLAAVKPVVVYMSSAATSGGYYAALAGDYIVASPSTLTGSIGVRMELAEMKQLMDTLGIRQQSLASGPLKEAGTPFRPMRAEEKDYLQAIVQDMYECFIGDVAAERRLPLDRVRELADGRAFTGRQALALGLIDELGDQDKAARILMARCGFGDQDKKDRDGKSWQPEYLYGPAEDKSWLLGLLANALLDLRELQAGGANPLPGFYY
ncbi:MAG: signal peptide peptidase SppA [Deltaproteobacteria bacterium]|jgi:protease-4|nr:signal peptide peptidase SppA [Deltaproteobacteria bacterium]